MYQISGRCTHSSETHFPKILSPECRVTVAFSRAAALRDTCSQVPCLKLGFNRKLPPASGNHKHLEEIKDFYRCVCIFKKLIEKPGIYK